MPFSAVDPSLAVGFYCCDQDDFNSFCNAIKEVRGEEREEREEKEKEKKEE